jgi:NTE family protein
MTERVGRKGIEEDSAANGRPILGLLNPRIGLALSGGSVRGLAHIGVIKALTERGIRPTVIAGTSAGSLVGAGLAAGMDWVDLKRMANSVFWPSLLYGASLESFCARHLPLTFAQLLLPFAAVATGFPEKKAVIIREGGLASAISASCAMRIIRRSVVRDGQRLKDGGIVCVLPALVCRELGADLVISSDVWELSSLLRSMGIPPSDPRASRIYPSNYLAALKQTDLLIQPEIPVAGYVPGRMAVERMIAAGEEAVRHLKFAGPAGFCGWLEIKDLTG